MIFGREIRKFSYSTFQHIGVWKLELAWFSNECSECTHALWCLTLLVSQVLELHERWACGLYLLCWYDWFIGCSCWRISFISLHLPSKGLSDVTGIVADTMLRNTVKDRSMVTPEIIPLDVILYVCVVIKTNSNHSMFGNAHWWNKENSVFVLTYWWTLINKSIDLGQAFILDKILLFCMIFSADVKNYFLKFLHATV